MTLTLQLTKQQETRLRQSARVRDEKTMRQILGEAIGPTVEKLLKQEALESTADPQHDEFEEIYRDWLASFSAATENRVVPAEFLSRASLYPDR